MSFVSRGFTRRRRDAPPGRLPPGQYDVGAGFPVLSAGPTPRTSPSSWDFRVQGQVDEVRCWSWAEFQGLPRESVSVDVHCVTSWSKFDTRWEGVSVDTLLADVVTAAEFVVAFSDGGYTTNLPLADLTNGQAWVV
ncbi:MAG TPA: molybdopterin-dependent oxidoreductase, partial [Pseudonocardiaceae bacterium]|nr:molybdopterin-dependent oxidoreductase [Pseudonocardiaceae bacterium]